jgi:predicted metal-dependent hydrolase
VKKVYLWHWCEELEHHSVTINLLTALDKSWQTRVKAAHRILTKFLPACWDVVIDIEKFYSPHHYRAHAAVDIPLILRYFTRGLGVAGKYFNPNCDIIEVGGWSWKYIEDWRAELGFAAPVEIIQSSNVALRRVECLE